MRRQILGAAAEVIAREGIGGLRYDQVAELADVNKSSVYRNWPDRTALIADALATFGADAAPLRDSGDLAGDLVEFLEALAAATASPEGRAMLSVVASARENVGLRAVVDDVFDRRQAVVRDRLRSAVEAGDLPATDLTLLSELLTAPVQMSVSRGARRFVRADAEQLVAIVLAGVGAVTPGAGTRR